MDGSVMDAERIYKYAEMAEGERLVLCPDIPGWLPDDPGWLPIIYRKLGKLGSMMTAIKYTTKYK